VGLLIQNGDGDFKESPILVTSGRKLPPSSRRDFLMPKAMENVGT
jgi:hypothetical protein